MDDNIDKMPIEELIESIIHEVMARVERGDYTLFYAVSGQATADICRN
jgi:hypothetical protein